MDTLLNNGPKLEKINQILSYLERTPINGNEAPTFIACVKALQEWGKAIEKEGK